MLVRREIRADHPIVRDVHLAAFARDGGPAVEAALTERLREGPWFLPALSLVVVADADGPASGVVVGHVIATRGVVEPSGRPAMGIGPLGVAPAWQGRGVGSALMHALLGAAEATGERIACLLGSRYYRRFGFRPSAEAGIAAPDPAWGAAFQARLFGEDPVRPGTFRYAAPFDAL
ncbi:MAG: N-acetyltransferase [Pseudonocardia sp.]|nr:N-acetyltransferase [Pseudonocardia sp.]